MGLFKKRAADPAEIDRLKSEIAAMSARLDAADSAKDELGEQVLGIVTRLDTPIAPPPDAPPPAPPPTVDPAELDDIRRRLDELDATPPAPPPPTVDPAELGDIRRRLDELGTRLDGVDARITAISTELANQITELSGDIEALGEAAPPASEELVDELRDGQTRLAAEQARYQIAFRQDLAELADRLRRS